jgi:hypothetical protein
MFDRFDEVFTVLFALELALNMLSLWWRPFWSLTLCLPPKKQQPLHLSPAPALSVHFHMLRSDDTICTLASMQWA